MNIHYNNWYHKRRWDTAESWDDYDDEAISEGSDHYNDGKQDCIDVESRYVEECEPRQPSEIDFARRLTDGY